jgi:hypothetical protein
MRVVKWKQTSIIPGQKQVGGSNRKRAVPEL